MHDDWAGRRPASQPDGDLESVVGIAGVTGLEVQVVVERNEDAVWQELPGLGDEPVSAPPEPGLHRWSDPGRGLTEGGRALLVVLQDQEPPGSRYVPFASNSWHDRTVHRPCRMRIRRYSICPMSPSSPIGPLAGTLKASSITSPLQVQRAVPPVTTTSRSFQSWAR